jgi:hypothetical protein
MNFKTIQNPNFDLLNELYLLSGEICHYNPGVMQNINLQGATLLAFKVISENQTVAYGVARESNSWNSKRLAFNVLPIFLTKSKEVSSCFWEGLLDHCHKQGVIQLDLNAFNSSPVEVPNLGAILKFTRRSEFILDLKEIKNHGKKLLSSNHRRNITKGERAGLSYDFRSDLEACKDHAMMMAHSMRRRKSIGQSIHYKPSPQKWHAYIQSKAGFIVQAKRNNTWISSLLILQSSRQAYYVSGGTSPEGMQVGAAHYLMWKVIQHLSSTGVLSLNLGGVSETDTPGLERFKSGFGAKPVELPHRSYIIGSKWRYLCCRAIKILRSSRK